MQIRIPASAPSRSCAARASGLSAGLRAARGKGERHWRGGERGLKQSPIDWVTDSEALPNREHKGRTSSAFKRGRHAPSGCTLLGLAPVELSSRRRRLVNVEIAIFESPIWTLYEVTFCAALRRDSDLGCRSQGALFLTCLGSAVPVCCARCDKAKRTSRKVFERRELWL